MKINKIMSALFIPDYKHALPGGTHGRIHWLFLAVIAIQVIWMIFLASEKKGFFIDELYSFGLSNSADRAFLNREKSIQNRWVDGHYFHKYLTVQKTERFSYSRVYHNQSVDVHPPLFYFVLHTICSFSPDFYSKWQGFFLNIFLFVISQIFLCRIGMKITDNQYATTAAAMILYGGTLLAGDNVVFVRMYMMLTMWSLVCCYMHLVIFDKKMDWVNILLLFLIVYAGCMTHYYFCILAFFLAVFWGIHFLFSKRMKDFYAYTAVMFLSTVTFLSTYPAVWEHLFGGRLVGAKTMDNFSKILQIPTNLCICAIDFVSLIIIGGPRFIMLAILCAVTLAMILLAIIIKRKGSQGILKLLNKKIIFLILPITAVFVVVAWLAFIPIPRYMYFIYPLIVLLCVIFFVSLLSSGMDKYPKLAANAGKILLILTICVSAANMMFRKSSIMYTDEYRNAQMMTKYADCYGIFVLKKNISSALTQDCRALMQLKGVYCTEPIHLKNLKTILHQKKTHPLIVFVDCNKDWSSGYNSEKIISEILASGMYKKSQRLYLFGLVDCYVLN